MLTLKDFVFRRSQAWLRYVNEEIGTAIYNKATHKKGQKNSRFLQVGSWETLKQSRNCEQK